jgi:hypothetical protein
MKTKYAFLIAAGLLLCLYACKKPGCDPGNMGPVTIIGNWNIVSDSTFAGVGVDNHPVDYQGQPGTISISQQMALSIQEKGLYWIH